MTEIGSIADSTAGSNLESRYMYPSTNRLQQLQLQNRLLLLRRQQQLRNRMLLNKQFGNLATTNSANDIGAGDVTSDLDFNPSDYYDTYGFIKLISIFKLSLFRTPALKKQFQLMIPVSTFSKRVGNKLEHLLYPFDCNYYSYLLLEANVAKLDFTAIYSGNILPCGKKAQL